MKIEILGGGCAKCKVLYGNAVKAVENTKADAVIEKVEDFERIMDYGVTSTPALVIDGEVKSSGKVLSADEIMAFL